MNISNRLNSTMDRDDLFDSRYNQTIEDIISFEKNLESDGIDFCSWHGARQGLKFPYYNKKALIFQKINRGKDYEPYPNKDHNDLRNPWFRLWSMSRIIVDSKINENSKVLAVGESCSLLSFFLATKVDKIVCIDLSKELVDYSNGISKERFNSKLINHQMDVQYQTRIDIIKNNFISDFPKIKKTIDRCRKPNYMPFNLEKSVFDLIIFSDVLIHIKDKYQAVKNAIFSLKSNGIIVISENYLNPDPNRFQSRKTIEEIALKAGLKQMGPEFVDNGKKYLWDYERDKRYSFFINWFKKI